MRPRLIIAPGKDKALLRRHPWIFSGAVKRVVGEPQEGDLVDVVAPDGRWLAVGHYQSDSIICKVLSFDTPDIDEAFFRRRLQSAIDYRRRLGFFDYLSQKAPCQPLEVSKSRSLEVRPQATNVFRLVHAEGDLLPGLVCDWYNGIVVMQAHSVGMHRLFPMFVDLFRNLLGDSLLAVFDKSSATCPAVPEGSAFSVPSQGGVPEGRGGSKITDKYLWGITPTEHEITESGNRLLINFYEGQKTGFFIDQRDNRAMVQRLAKGHRMLNCFGYTGGFSLAALRGGAEFVETVDISKKAIELCNRNVALNFGPDAPHRGTVADVMTVFSGQCSVVSDQCSVFSDAAQQKLNTKHSTLNTQNSTQLNTKHSTLNTKYDFIILDPPAFAKNHRSLQQGLKGYRTINQRAMEVLPEGGLLMTFSCSQAVSVDDFRTMVFTAAANAHRQVRVVSVLPHAADHPVSIYHPEGEYLKGLLLEIR